MKMSVFFILICILVWTTLTTPLVAFAESPKNLITDGDFEKNDTWENWGGFSYTSDYKDVFCGKSSGVIKQRESGAGNIIQKINPNEMYKLSAYGKVNGLGQEGIIGAECLDITGKKIKGGRFILRFNTSTYQEKERTFYTVPGTAQIQVYMYVIDIVNGGAAFFDNISLTKFENKDYVNPNNGAFLPKDWFNSHQNTDNIQSYVNELKSQGIKYQFVDIGLLNSDGSMNPENYIALGQWIKISKKVDPNQCIIGVFNYNQRNITNNNGSKISNPDFGTELFKSNINSLADTLVNKGINIDETSYHLDGVSIDFEEFVNDDQLLLDCLKYLKTHSLVNNKYLSVSAPINYSSFKTWSNNYINEVSNIVDQINPMLYDLMGWESSVNSNESYEIVCKAELKRFSDSLNSISVNGEKCKLFPLVPSYERRMDSNSLVIYHDPQIESILSSINAIKDSKNNGINIYGAGIFWWATFMGHYPNLYQPSYYLIDQYNWMAYWVNNAS